MPWSRRKKLKTLFASIALAALAGLGGGAIYLAYLIHTIEPTLPTMAQIAGFKPAEGTHIYSSEGVLLATLQIENRRPVPLKSISPDLINATLAAEDSRFYAHHGIDPHGILRAAWANLTDGDATGQGGSTITQQLARNVSQFGVSKQKSLARKVREAMTAVRIEQVFDKDRILELYLNQVYYGSGAYGVEAASRTYFGKPAAKLTLAQAALLAGLPQRPAYYSPYTNAKAALVRRNVVLQRMLDLNKITEAQYNEARAEKVKLAGYHPHPAIYRAPYFVDWVVQNLVSRYGVDAVYSGWTVQTTLSWSMQQAAERALRGGLSHGATQGALVSVDPHTGEVRAMVGGVDYHKDQFNAVTQGQRQPGSAFKPIIYTAALDTGTVTLTSQYSDTKQAFNDGYKTWVVHNYGGGYSNRQRTVLDAIAHSINTIAAQVTDQTGVNRVIDYAHRMGITSNLAPYLSIALGSSAVRPIDLCSAYGIFAADGVRYTPTGIRQVKDASGRVILQDDPIRRMVPDFLEPTTISQINRALRDVVLRGTGTAAGSIPNAFGKTGTTNDQRDAWFIGYTPELVTAVWAARPYRDSHGVVRYRVMPGATGGRVAAPIWARYMSRALPVQQIANRQRHAPHWAISVPDEPQTETADKTEPDVQQGASAPDDTPDGAPGMSVQGVTTEPGPAPQAAGPMPMMWAPPRGAVVIPGYAPARPMSQPVAEQSQGPMVTARICADSGELATRWCPTTVLVQMPQGTVPRSYCHLHGPPAGER